MTYENELQQPHATISAMMKIWIIFLPYTAEAMAIFPTYLTTSFINKFCSPPVNQYSPFPTIEVRRNKMVQWMKIKCVTLRSARSYPPRLLLLLGFSHQNGAQQHTTATEKERQRDGEIERGDTHTERERNSWSDEKKRSDFLQYYHKLIRQTPRLYSH